MSPQCHVTYADVQRRLLAARRRLQLQNVAAMHAVAASLPRQAGPARQGAQNSREAAALAGATASTTSTRSGGLSGCSTQSA